MSFALRSIASTDNLAMAKIIRSALAEFGSNQPSLIQRFNQIDALSALYDKPGHRYLIAEQNQQVLGGAGVAPLDCEHDHVCELQNMYLSHSARGLGIGRSLLTRLLQFARTEQYQYCYLETYASMTQAQQLYRSLGFADLDAPWRKGDHQGCDRFFFMKL